MILMYDETEQFEFFFSYNQMRLEPIRRNWRWVIIL